jgi:SAM-dependent methyltransferase
MELLIGSGHSREKRIGLEGETGWNHLVTLDMNHECNPDVVHDLAVMPLPFEDSIFDEIHAYEVLEHVGTNGDWRFFFAQFDDFWRLLKPGGFFFATVPSPKGIWAWGDPGHTRVFSVCSLVFLERAQYAKQCGITSMTDYRPYFKSDWKVISSEDNGEEARFVLRAIK